MNSDSFDKYIKDKITSIEDDSFQQWDSSSVWKQIEGNNKKSFFIGWKPMLAAACIIMLLANSLFLFFQYEEKCIEISALVKEKQEKEKHILQIENQLSASNNKIRLAEEIKLQQEENIKNIKPFTKISVLPIIIHQADIIIQNIPQEVKMIVMNIPLREEIKTETIPRIIEIKYEHKTIKTPKKNKFRINIFNKSNNIFASK